MILVDAKEEARKEFKNLSGVVGFGLGPNSLVIYVNDENLISSLPEDYLGYKLEVVFTDYPAEETDLPVPISYTDVERDSILSQNKFRDLGGYLPPRQEVLALARALERLLLDIHSPETLFEDYKDLKLYPRPEVFLKFFAEKGSRWDIKNPDPEVILDSKHLVEMILEENPEILNPNPELLLSSIHSFWMLNKKTFCREMGNLLPGLSLLCREGILVISLS